MFDCAIVGTGPAGVSAALNLKLHNKNFIWFGTPKLSSKISSAEKIGNYPGLSMITGTELQQAYLQQLQDMDITINDSMVTMISSAGNSFMLLADNVVYKAKTVILATGVVSTRMLPGEADFVGRGLSYCATCDGFLYKSKTIAVLCKSKRFEHEIDYLAELAEKVYLFAEYKNPETKSTNIEIMTDKCTGISGGLKLQSVIMGNDTAIDVDGMFILRDAIAPTTLFPGLQAEKGMIQTDRSMATNIPGCFACGDCTGAPYQYVKAAGEGNIAAHSVIRYLANME